MRPWKPLLLLTALALLTLAGCSGNVRVTGQVVENGQSFALPKGEALEVHFITMDPEVVPGRDYMKMVSDNGSFVADQADNSGRGLPPGKYKVTLHSETPVVGQKLRGKPELSTDLQVARGSPVHLTIDLGARTITH